MNDARIVTAWPTGDKAGPTGRALNPFRPQVMESTLFASLASSMAFEPLGYGLVGSSVAPTHVSRHLHQRRGAMRCDVMRCGEDAYAP